MKGILEQIFEWSMKNFGNNPAKAKGYEGTELKALASLLGVGEEFGELCHVVLKRHQGIRGYDDDDQYERERDDALADILIYLCDFANREGVDLFAKFQSVWEAEVQKRNWTENKQDGTHDAIPTDVELTE